MGLEMRRSLKVRFHSEVRAVKVYGAIEVMYVAM